VAGNRAKKFSTMTNCANSLLTPTTRDTRFGIKSLIRMIFANAGVPSAETSDSILTILFHRTWAEAPGQQ
jgi:hypothetical protein